MSYTVTLDPSAVATGRTELELNSGSIRVEHAGIDWGDAEIQAYAADQRWGSSVVDFRVPNRTVTIPLGLGMDSSSFTTAKRALSEKVALLQREGGWLRRGDTGWYADVVKATLNVPDRWGEGGGVEVDVKLVLECLPDFYGDEITQDATTGTGQLSAVIKQSAVQAVISGDHPARCRILLSDTSGHSQDAVLWGVRSRHYDSAGTAKLFYEAEALTPLDAAATFAHSGASGGSTMRHNSLPGGAWCPVLLTDIVSGAAAWTQQGSYRVWARCYSASATPQLRFTWGVGDVAHPVTNDAVTLPGAANFYLVDLGEVRLDAPPTGNYRWHGVIQAKAASQGNPIEIDCIYLQPLDEAAGQLIAVQSSTNVLVVDAQNVPGTAVNDSGVGTFPWTVLTPRSPAAGNTVTGTSNWLKLTNFGFAIPTGSTIRGITVQFQKGAGPDGATKDSALRLIKAGAIQATDRADTATPWPGGYFPHPVVTYGAQADLWGGTWTPADINNSDFGFALSIALTVANDGWTESLFDPRITVYYTTSGGFTTAPDAVCYASRQAELRTEGHFRQDSTGTVEGAVAQVLGDLPRLPPSGLEGRAVELFLKPSRGDLASLPDSGLDAFSAQVIYRPTYLTSP